MSEQEQLLGIARDSGLKTNMATEFNGIKSDIAKELHEIKSTMATIINCHTTSYQIKTTMANKQDIELINFKLDKLFGKNGCSAYRKYQC